jgi:hypothetical protein
MSLSGMEEALPFDNFQLKVKNQLHVRNIRDRD